MNTSFLLPTWKNITISGKAASGATTLSRALARKLGWKLWNGGELYRAYVKEKGIPLEKTTEVSDKYHIDLDNYIKNKLTTETHQIIESWLSGFDAQEIPGVFKIFVICSDDAVRIDRLITRDNMTVEQAQEHLRIREQENLKKWEQLYKTRDFWNPKLYDLVIDTYTTGPAKTLDIALEAIGYKVY